MQTRGARKRHAMGLMAEGDANQSHRSLRAALYPPPITLEYEAANA